MMLLLFGGSGTLCAQDLIYLHEGETIEAVVVDITPGVVKYRKYDDSKDRIYAIARIAVKKVVYSSGKTEEFELPEITEQALTDGQGAKPVRHPPVFGWHIGIGASTLTGDVEGAEPKLAVSIGASFMIPVWKRNNLYLEASFRSLGSDISDYEQAGEDGTRYLFTDVSYDLGYIGLTVFDRIFLTGSRSLYVEAGGYGSYLLNAFRRADIEAIDSLGVSLGTSSSGDNVSSNYKNYDFGIAAGLGGAFYLSKNRSWKITAALRFSYGLTNIVGDDYPVPEEGYRESNMLGLILLGIDIPTGSGE